MARLWSVTGARLFTSTFAVVEARRNLGSQERLVRLERLLEGLEIVAAGAPDPEIRGEVRLPEKDWPIVGGALAVHATHLVTGDLQHFGPYFGLEVLGIRVVRPAAYLRARGR